MEAYENGNTASWIGLGVLNAAYKALTPGGDSLSDVNARAWNGEQVSGKELAITGGIAIGQVALTATPQLLSAKPLVKAVADAVAKGEMKSQPINALSGKLRLETHLEAVPKALQKSLGVKVSGAVQKPWHLVVNGNDVMLNPYNPLWKLFPGGL